jgi:hypothetical protein
MDESLGVSQLKHWENFKGVCEEKTWSVQLNPHC